MSVRASEQPKQRGKPHQCRTGQVPTGRSSPYRQMGVNARNREHWPTSKRKSPTKLHITNSISRWPSDDRTKPWLLGLVSQHASSILAQRWGASDACLAASLLLDSLSCSQQTEIDLFSSNTCIATEAAIFFQLLAEIPSVTVLQDYYYYNLALT